MSNKKIGILTSGGDCGGLNAAIRSIFYRAKNKYKMDVYGIKNSLRITIGTSSENIVLIKKMRKILNVR